MQLELYELLVRILCDNWEGRQFDAIFLVSQTTDNENSVLQKGIKLYEQGLTNFLVILEPRAGGYPGGHALKKKINPGVAKAIRMFRPHDIALIHTTSEAMAFVRHAKRNGYKKVAVISPPFHLLRSFISCVSAAIRTYPELCIYSIPGVAFSWNDMATHSQGEVRAKRSELLFTELERIIKYQEKGDLESTQSILDYLNQRI